MHVHQHNMDIDNFDDDGLIISRERVSNEYSYVNANMVLLASVGFLFDGHASIKKRYKMMVQFYNIIDYRNFASENVDDEEFPFKKNTLDIARHGKMCHLTCNGSKIQRFHGKDLVSFVRKMFGKHRFKIESITISCMHNSVRKYKKIYSSKLYHISYMNPTIENKAASTIGRYWRSYQEKKNEHFKHEHKKNMQQVYNEIVCLPPGGYLGNLSTFLGGHSFLECYQRFMAR